MNTSSRLMGIRVWSCGVSILRATLAGLVVSALASGAGAVTVDLTPGPGSSGTVNGVLFEFDDMQPAGGGVLEPFVRIQAKGTEEGYNTSNPIFPFDEVPPAGGFTRDLRFGDLVATGGNFQFVLDIAEPRGGSKSLLSLDALQIYVSDTGSQNTTNLGDLGTLLYDLDAGEDSTILMDAAAAAGSGVSDVLLTVPPSLFAGVSADDFVIFYSRFGDTESSGGGFEEWAALVPCVLQLETTCCVPTAGAQPDPESGSTCGPPFFDACEVELPPAGNGFVGLGGEVEYQYKVTNNSDEDAIVNVTDDPFGDVAIEKTVARNGGMETFFVTQTLLVSLTNTATVSGVTTPSMAMCEPDMDSVDVTLTLPPQ